MLEYRWTIAWRFIKDRGEIWVEAKGIEQEWYKEVEGTYQRYRLVL